MDVEIKDILVKLLEGQIKLESIDKKLDIIAEVQTSHKEQNEKALNGLDSKLEEKTSLIEAATKSISMYVNGKFTPSCLFR